MNTINSQDNQAPNEAGFAVLRTGDHWLQFVNPSTILSTNRIEDVIPILKQIEQATASGSYAAGFLTFEAASAFDRALQTHEPGAMPLAWFGLYDEVEIIENLHSEQPESVHLCWTPSVSESQYTDTVKRIKEEIRAGNTYQVNYSFRQRSPFTQNPYASFVSLTRQHTTPYAAFINTGAHAVSSLSPELFFSMENGQITCRPMKGTAPRGKTQSEDKKLQRSLKQSEKDKAENLMVVDMIRNDLGRVATNIHTSKIFSLETYETLYQMTSTVTGKSTESLTNIFKALFPSASITGAPKVNTINLIRQLEQDAREVYTGTVGFITPDHRAQFNVAIRTLVIDLENQQATYGAGSGIVWDSDPHSEYQECITKTKIVSDRSDEFNLLETLRWSPNERYYLLDYHLARLQASATHFLFDINMSVVKEKLHVFAESLDQAPHRIQLQLDKKGNIALSANPQPTSSSEYRVSISTIPIDSEDRFMYHKTTRRGVYEETLAAHPTVDDVLLYNRKREATESCIANLVVVMDGQHFTPPVESGLLNGTYRQDMIDKGKLQERVISIDSLGDYDEVYLINSVRGKIDIELVS